MGRSLRRNKKGISTILASVLMVVIVVVASVIVLAWSTGILGFGRQDAEDYRQAYTEAFAFTHGKFLPSGTGEIEDDLGSPPSPSSFNRDCPPPITSAYTGNVRVPSNQVCEITAQVTGNIYAFSGSTLRIVGTLTQSGNVEANEAAEVTITNTNVKGNLDLFKVQTVTISGSVIEGNVRIRGSASISISDTDIYGNVDMDGNQGVGFTDNFVTGNWESNGNGWCSASGNIVNGAPIANCDDKFVVHIINTSTLPVRIRNIYTDGKLSAGAAWKLLSNASMTCGGVVQSGICGSFPILIPPGETAEISPVWAPPPGTPIQNATPQIVLLTRFNFVEGRIDYTHGLLMASKSRLMPRFCPCP